MRTVDFLNRRRRHDCILFLLNNKRSDALSRHNSTLSSNRQPSLKIWIRLLLLGKNSTFSGFLKSIESVFCFWVCKKSQDDKKTNDVRGVLLQTIKGESQLHLA